MQSLFVLALSLLPLALGAPANDVTLSKRTPGNVFLCTEENWSGTCKNVFFPLGECQEVPGEYLFNIGSAGPDAGAICTFFAAGDSNCGGTGLAILAKPGADNLYSENGNPGGNVEYIRCNECTNCT